MPLVSPVQGSLTRSSDAGSRSASPSSGRPENAAVVVSPQLLDDAGASAPCEPAAAAASAKPELSDGGARSKSTGPAMRARRRAWANNSANLARSAGLTAAERRRAMGLAPARSSQVLRKGLPSNQARRSRTAPRPQARQLGANNLGPSPPRGSGAAAAAAAASILETSSRLPQSATPSPGVPPRRAVSAEEAVPVPPEDALAGRDDAAGNLPLAPVPPLEGPLAGPEPPRLPMLQIERACVAELVPAASTRHVGVGSTELTHQADAETQASTQLSDHAVQTVSATERAARWGVEAAACWSCPDIEVDDNDSAVSVAVAQLRAQLAAACELVARSEFEARLLGCDE